MSYSSQTDLERAAGGADELVELTDIGDTGSLDTATMGAAISGADAWIDSYLQRRYAVPLASTPEEVKQVSAQEAIYRLRTNRRLTTEADHAAHDERRKFLQDITDGRASVGIDPGPGKSTNVTAKTIARSDTEDVSRASLKGFW